jgi:hypothetical protein
MFLLPGLLMLLCYSLMVAKLLRAAVPGEQAGHRPQGRTKIKVGSAVQCSAVQ